MMYLSPALVLAALAPPAAGLSNNNPVYLPSGIEHVTTTDYVPQALGESEVDLCRVRFTGAAENDLAVLRADELGMLVRPGRLESFYTMRSGVAAIAALPKDNGQESLLVASVDGLELVGCDPTTIDLHSPDTTTPLSTGPGWHQTRGIWVHVLSDGTVDVFGAHQEELLHVHFDGAAWIDNGALPVFGELQELAWFDYNSSGTQETVWRFPNAIGIQDSQSLQFLVTYAAHPTDRIAAMVEPGTGISDRLAWSTQWPVGNHVLGVIENEALTTWRDIEGDRPAALVPFEFSDGASAPNGREVMAVSATLPYGFLQGSTGAGGPQDPYPTYDCHPNANVADLRDDPLVNSSGTGSIAAAAGDFDGDGRDDLAFMRSDGQLRFWLGHYDRFEHSFVMPFGTTGPVPYIDVPTGNLKMILPMHRGSEVAVGGTVHIRAWFRDQGVNQPADFIGDSIVTEQPDPNSNPGSDDVIFDLNFGNAAYTPGEPVRLSVTPRIFDNGALVGYGVTRQLYWLPTVSGPGEHPEIDLEPQFSHRAISGAGGQPGDGTGTRTGGGQNNPPSTPPPGGG